MDNHSEWIDYRQLQDSSGGDEEFSRELIEAYITDADSRVQAIRQALQSGDLVQIGRNAHTLKGSSANVGAIKVAEVCHRLEELMRTNSRQNFESIIIELEKTFKHTSEALQSDLA